MIVFLFSLSSIVVVHIDRSIDLTRDNDITACRNNNGQLHRFSRLPLKNITVSTVRHRWNSSIEPVEAYARFRREGDDGQWDGYLCECIDPSSFGKNYEYRLQMGNS
jgi:hypothetical protein